MVASVDSYVADTNVVSYLYRGDAYSIPFRAYATTSNLVVSFMTVAELDQWAMARNWGTARRAEFARFLTRFAIIMPDRDMCRIWAEVTQQARRNGRPIMAADAGVAATAMSIG